jgi:endonuclease-3
MKPARTRIAPIIKMLRKAYPDSRTALRFRNPLQILIATILAAQCTDERVNKITPALFKKYGRAAGFAKARQSVLENEIRSTGFFRNKAKNIIGASKIIVGDFKGRVPDSMEELLTLPGVARKTANIVLSSGYGKAEGIAVDTHVKRLSERMGLSKEKDPNKIERDLLKIVPRKDWLDFNYLLVNHGRAVCQARKPLCPECPIRRLCPSAKKFYPALKMLQNPEFRIQNPEF